MARTAGFPPITGEMSEGQRGREGDTFERCILSTEVAPALSQLAGRGDTQPWCKAPNLCDAKYACQATSGQLSIVFPAMNTQDALRRISQLMHLVIARSGRALN